MEKKPSLKIALIYWCGSSITIAILFMLEKFLNSMNIESPLLIGSLTASAVLLLTAPKNPLSRWQNVIGGHTISAFIGVTFYFLLSDYHIIAATFAVSTSIAIMYMTSTLHPPGAATAFIAVTGGAAVHDLGYFYVLMPCATGASLLFGTAWLTHYFVHKVRVRSRTYKYHRAKIKALKTAARPSRQ